MATSRPDISYCCAWAMVGLTAKKLVDATRPTPSTRALIRSNIRFLLIMVG